jgi:selenocysteine lyase/cysteine desulfurase
MDRPRPVAIGGHRYLPARHLDVRRLGAALTAARIVCTTRTGAQMPGLRLSPHFYNTMDEVDRVVGAIRKYLASGV